MAVKIPPAQIQNLQQLEAVVAGPDGANRLFIIDGQFDAYLNASSQSNNPAIGKETFTVLLGPVFTRETVRSGSCDRFSNEDRFQHHWRGREE